MLDNEDGGHRRVLTVDEYNALQPTEQDHYEKRTTQDGIQSYWTRYVPVDGDQARQNAARRQVRMQQRRVLSVEVYDVLHPEEQDHYEKQTTQDGIQSYLTRYVPVDVDQARQNATRRQVQAQQRRVLRVDEYNALQPSEQDRYERRSTQDGMQSHWTRYVPVDGDQAAFWGGHRY
jgi:hypothetical protein